MYPRYTLGERIADGVIHAIGVTASIIAVIVLLAMAIPSLPVPSTTSLAIYGGAMVAMFSFSAAYHLTPVPDWKHVLGRLDQAAIFIKIAGTYTPFALVKLGGLAGFGLLGTVWAVALAGATAKLVLPIGANGFFIVLYLALGWAGLLVIEPLFAAVPTASMVLLGAGGGLYSLGVVFHLWTRLPYQNAIWHGFVLAGASCHYVAVLIAVA